MKRVYKNFLEVCRLSALILFVSFIVVGQEDEEEDYISPVRPTVSDSATVQEKGVLQIEFGGDFDFDSPDYRNRQAAPFAAYYAVNKRFRLDLELDAAVSQKDSDGRRETGAGDVRLGFKAIAREEPKERLAVAFAYTIKLPAASAEKNLGTGKIEHNLKLILNRTFGKTNYVFNAAYLNVGREDSGRRLSGAQTVFTVERELPNRFGIVGEIFGNTVDEVQPRGIYLLGALTYKINKRFQFDIGLRPGFGRDAPRIGVFAGVSVGVANLLSKK